MAKLALNAGTVRQGTLTEQIVACRSAGFDGFGMWLSDLEAFERAGGAIADVQGLLNGMPVVELDFLRDWAFASGSEWDRAAAAAENLITNAKRVGTDLVCAATLGGQGDASVTVRNFRAICQMAASHAIKVGLEFLPWTPIGDLRSAWAVVSEADCDNGGLLIDTFHFFMGGSRLEDLGSVPADKIFLVHIDDVVPDPSLDLLTLTRTRRVFPGEGNLPLRDFLVTLGRQDYDGYFSLEVLSDKLRALPTLEAAKQGMASLARLFGQVE